MNIEIKGEIKMSFKNWKEFILNIIFWTTILVINQYIFWWKGYFQCMKDSLNNKLQIEIIDNSDGNKIIRKTTGWINLKDTLKIEQDKK